MLRGLGRQPIGHSARVQVRPLFSSPHEISPPTPRMIALRRHYVNGSHRYIGPKFFGILFVSLLCASCTLIAGKAPKIADVKAEVQRTVTVGRSITFAASRLGASGFGCSGVNPVQCSRQVNSCVEQVLIFADEHFMVTRAEVDGVNCLYTP